MREITKTFFSFSWAMSLFGIQQTTNLMSPERASKAFHSVTEATEEQFSDVLKTAFNAGDKLQRNAVDLTLGMVTGEALNPNKWIRMASDAARQSAEAVTQGVQGVTSTVRQAAATDSPQGSGEGKETANYARASTNQGWGPMPS
jgi:flagellar hook-basal body complex protein FliE